MRKRDLEKRIRSLENFRWRLRNSLSTVLEKDVTEDSLGSVTETVTIDEYETASSKSDSDVEPEMEIETHVIQESQNDLASMHLVAETVSNLVWPLLRDWLNSKDKEGNRKLRFSKFLRLIDPRNVFQALAERDDKAKRKYGEGLSLEDAPANFQPAIEKLSDSVYFLFLTTKSAEQLRVSNPNEYARQLNTITDLHNILGSFIGDLKAK